MVYVDRLQGGFHGLECGKDGHGLLLYERGNVYMR